MKRAVVRAASKTAEMFDPGWPAHLGQRSAEIFVAAYESELDSWLVITTVVT